MADDFLSTYAPLANDIATQTHLDPAVVLGIIDTETGGGQHVAGNNIFGISPGGQVARYPDVQTAAQAFVSLMQTPRYQAATQAPTPAAQAAMLVRGGYNTVNPNWGPLVAGKAANFGKQLGYQDAAPGDGPQKTAATTAVPDYNDPPAAATAPSSAKNDLKGELSGSGQPAPAAPTQQPRSAKDDLKQELSQPPAPGALTGPPDKKPPDTSKDYSVGNPMGDQGGMGGSSMPSQGIALPNLPGPVRRIIQAGEEGAAGTEDTRNLLSTIFPPPPGLPDVVGQLLNPAIKGVGAILRGGQQAAAEIAEPIGRMIPSIQVPRFNVDFAGKGPIPGLHMQFEGNLGGGPGLGRDVAALPEAFPTGGILEAPRGPATAQQARNFLGQPITVADITGAMRRSDANAPPNLLDQSRLGQPEAHPVVGGDVPPSAGPSGGGGQPPGPSPAPGFLNNSWIRQAGDTGAGYDMGKGGAALAGAAQDALDSGSSVALVVDGGRRTVPIVGVKNGMLMDDKGQSWGSMSIATDGTGQEGLRITPKADGGAAPTEEPIPGRGGSVGAAQTTVPIDDPVKAQTATNIRTDVAQTAADRAGPGLRDDTAYVPGIPERPEAFKNFSRQNALDHKYQLSKDPDYRTQIDAINTKRNEGMTDLIKPEMGDGNTLADLYKQRREFTPDKMGVFEDEKPVDPALLEGFKAKVQGLLEGPTSKRAGVRGILEQVYSTLFDKEGNLETLPSRLQGVRDNMTDWLDKRSGSDSLSKDVAAAQQKLTELVNDLNPVMASGAPKWDLFRQKWAEMSRKIDQQEFLQNYAPGRTKSLWDSKGNLVFRKVQQLLADTANSYDKPVHEAQSLTDDQIQKIVNVRNELEAEDFTTYQGKFPGSPTVQLLERAAKEGGTSLAKSLGKLGGDALVHGVGAYLHQRGVPFVNTVYGMYQSTRPIREQNKAARKQAGLAEQSEAIKRNLLSQTGPTNYLNPPP